MQIDGITFDPAVMGGTPCVRGIRVTVSTVLGLLASGTSRARILKAYPYLKAEDLDAAVAYAAGRTRRLVGNALRRGAGKERCSGTED